MLKRKIEQRLIDWKNDPEHKPLIIKGCRQCGKTYSVLDFAKKNYAHVVYLNFFENPDYASVFSGSLEPDNIVMMLSALLGKNAIFETGKTVLILDEIHGDKHSHQRTYGIECLCQIQAAGSGFFCSHRQNIRITTGFQKRQSARHDEIGQQKGIIVSG